MLTTAVTCRCAGTRWAARHGMRLSSRRQGADAAGLDMFKLPDELAERRQARARHQKGL
jgi:hypothetical protein